MQDDHKVNSSSDLLKVPLNVLHWLAICSSKMGRLQRLQLLNSDLRTDDTRPRNWERVTVMLQELCKQQRQDSWDSLQVPVWPAGHTDQSPLHLVCVHRSNCLVLKHFLLLNAVIGRDRLDNRWSIAICQSMQVKLVRTSVEVQLDHGRVRQGLASWRRDTCWPFSCYMVVLRLQLFLIHQRKRQAAMHCYWQQDHGKPSTKRCVMLGQ